MSSTVRPSLPTSPRAGSQRGTLAFVIAPIAFTVLWLVLGFVSDGYDLWDMHIAPYSPVTQPISGLGMGATAPVMNSGCVLYGLAMVWGAVAFARTLPALDDGMRRRIALLLGLHGVGAVVVGVFDLEAIMLHLAGFLLVVSPAVTFLLVARQLRPVPGWKDTVRPLRVAALSTLLLTAAYFATFDPEAAGENAGIGGLSQRILVVQLAAWYVWLGVRARWSAVPPPPAE